MLAALDPWRERGSGWWAERSAREQILLGTLAGLALLALLLVAVIRPLEAARARAAADIRTADMLAMRLGAAGPSASGGARHGPPAAIVSQVAAANGLIVQRVAPEAGRLRVVLADAPFDAVLRWVAELEQTSTLRISEAQVDRSSTGAGVSAQFLLAGG